MRALHNPRSCFSDARPRLRNSGNFCQNERRGTPCRASDRKHRGGRSRATNSSCRQAENGWRSLLGLQAGKRVVQFPWRTGWETSGAARFGRIVPNRVLCTDSERRSLFTYFATWRFVARVMACAGCGRQNLYIKRDLRQFDRKPGCAQRYGQVRTRSALLLYGVAAAPVPGVAALGGLFGRCSNALVRGGPSTRRASWLAFRRRPARSARLGGAARLTRRLRVRRRARRRSAARAAARAAVCARRARRRPRRRRSGSRSSSGGTCPAGAGWAAWPGRRRGGRPGRAARHACLRGRARSSSSRMTSVYW